jgi:LacI family transcriptional regulator, galactose operon repressor
MSFDGENAEPLDDASTPGRDEEAPELPRLSRLTIRQVAGLAGVSIATVSRVLNGRADVSAETRQIVERVVRAHGYARRMPSRMTGRTGLVGITMPFAQPAYFATILAGAAEALYERDMRAVLCPTRHEHDREVSLLERLMHGQTDGALLVLPEESSGELRQLAGRDFRFVVIDPLHELEENIPTISAANASGANQATTHLVELGHRRIAVITGPPDGLASRRRLQGYHAALAAAGIMPDPRFEVAEDFVVAAGVAGAERLLGLADPPTAIFCFNDSLAIGAMQATRARGLRVPEDISIVGFDDTPEAIVAFPALTTVRQPLAEIGRMAVSLLARLLSEHVVEPLHVELATRLIIRSSSAPPSR